MKLTAKIKRYGDGNWTKIQWKAIIIIDQWLPIGLGFYKRDVSEHMTAYGFLRKCDAQAWADETIAQL